MQRSILYQGCTDTCPVAMAICFGLRQTLPFICPIRQPDLFRMKGFQCFSSKKVNFEQVVFSWEAHFGIPVLLKLVMFTVTVLPAGLRKKEHEKKKAPF